jgi:hypothetical protein
MTREDIIRMALKAGLHPYYDAQSKAIERFAALVAEAEREACARILDSVDNYANPMTARDCAEAIRARGSK